MICAPKRILWTGFTLDAMRRANPLPCAAAATAVLALAALVAAPGPAGAAKKRVHVKRPKAGQYIGQTRQTKELTLYVKGRTVRLAIAELKCGLPTARVAVRHLKLHRTKRGYRFALHGRRTVTYNDHYPAQRSRVD